MPVTTSPTTPYGPLVESRVRIVTWNLWWRLGDWKRRAEAIAQTPATTIRPRRRGMSHAFTPWSRTCGTERPGPRYVCERLSQRPGKSGGRHASIRSSRRAGVAAATDSARYSSGTKPSSTAWPIIASSPS